MKPSKGNCSICINKSTTCGLDSNGWCSLYYPKNSGKPPKAPKRLLKKGLQN